MNNEEELEVVLDDGIKRDATHELGMKHLSEAKKFVCETKKRHKTYSIPIQGGVIITTCPEKWDQYNKPYLRGNAAREVKS